MSVSPGLTWDSGLQEVLCSSPQQLGEDPMGGEGGVGCADLLQQPAPHRLREVLPPARHRLSGRPREVVRLTACCYYQHYHNELPTYLMIYYYYHC